MVKYSAKIRKNIRKICNFVLKIWDRQFLAPIENIKSMVTISILIVTALIGYGLRNSRLPKIPAQLMSVVVWFLLFFFGITVGANPEIINNIDRFGWQALVVALAGILGSCVAARCLIAIIKKGANK